MYIDADISNRLSHKARWANTAIDKSKVNATFKEASKLDSDGEWVPDVRIVATSNIIPGEEILLDYGVEYRWELAVAHMQIHLMSDDDIAYLLQLPRDRFSAKSYQALLITKRFRDTCTDCISCRLKNATLMEKHNESRRYCSVECQYAFYGLNK